MKPVILLATAIILICSCSKKEVSETKEKACSTIDKSLVPSAVKSGFQNKYPSDSVITWFRKDSIGYCAYFIQLTSKKLAEFDNTGVFLKEETDMDQQGNHEDSTGVYNPKATTGCECEIPE